MLLDHVYRVSKERGGCFILSDWELLRVSGNDRLSFLHNMTTLNVRDLPNLQSAYGLILNDRGKILTDFWIYRADPFVWLLFQPLLGTKAHAILGKYIIMEDVVVEDASDLWEKFLIIGPSRHPRESGDPCHPRKNRDWIPVFTGMTGGGWGFSGRGISSQNFYFMTSKSSIALFQEKLLALDIPLLPDPLYEILRIESGIPRYGIDFNELNIPWEARLDEAIHHGKGCYIGQEIVERAFSRGEIKKELFRFQVKGEISIPSGTKLFIDNHEAGFVTSSAVLPGSQNVAGLAYIQKKLLGKDRKFHLQGGAEGFLIEIPKGDSSCLHSKEKWRG
jgi:folate-binding protein YgfZ